MARLAASRLGFAVSIAALHLAALSPSAQAAWPHDPNNGNVAVCTAAFDQYGPMVVSDGAGGAIVTWYDIRSGTTYDIYAQRVNAAGVPQWTSNGVALCTAVNHQFNVVIVSDGAGGAIVTWQDGRSGTNIDIYAQRVNAAGAPQWTANGVALCTAVSDQNYPTIASDGAGGAIVTWYDFRSGTSYDIFAQRVNAAGAPQWTANGVALCTAASEQSVPTIVSDGSGGAVVTWVDFRNGNYDIYAQRVNSSGAPQWTPNGVSLCVAANDQRAPMIASDDAGGAIVTWQDIRSGTTYDIYAQRVSAAGVTQWIGNGVAMCTAANYQVNPAITSDGSGGAIVTWQDNRGATNYDVYTQKVNSAGAMQWTADGVALCIAANDQYSPTLASDGSGGAIVTWYDSRSTTSDIFAQRVSALGAPQWTTNGAAISTAANNQVAPRIASDDAGGAIIAWEDARALPGNDIYAQRIERYGYLGNPAPAVVSVKDTPNDQGGFVKVGWNASYLDVDPTAGVYEYRVWRSAPPNLATEQTALSRGITEDSDEAARTGRFLAIPQSATSYLWELVGRQQAFELEGYSMVTATTSDSVAGGNPRTAFMVEAGSSAYTSTPHWFSAPDSGYSVDNLGPVTPAPFTAAYSFGATHLHWGVNHEGDLAGYRLYRGSSSSFIPGPGNLVSAQPDTGFGDVGPAGNWYKLSAVDIHGNESVFAILGPDGTVDVPGSSVTALYFAPPSPNPTSRGTTFRFGLPREGAVTLTLFDQQGRRVREITRGVLPAGEHRLIWDGRDEAGNMVASGIYFVRFEGAATTLRARLAIVR